MKQQPDGDPTGNTDTASRNDLQTDAAILRLHTPRIAPVGKTKQPWIKWGRYATGQPPTDADIQQWTADPRTRGWAILCGSHTDGMGLVDVEQPGMEHPTIAAAVEAAPDHCRYRSLSGGAHVWIDLQDATLVTEQLAAIPTDQNDEWTLLAELRGKSENPQHSGAIGVVTGPGRPPLRADFAPWKLTLDEFVEWVKPIRQLDQQQAWKAARAAEKAANKATRTTIAPTGETVADVIADAVSNGSLDVCAVLPDGWDHVGDDQGRQLIRRPGSHSPTSGNVLDGRYVIHSTNVEWAEPGRAMAPAQVLAESRHSGDFAGAMREVEQAAAGEPSQYSGWPSLVLDQIRRVRQARTAEWKAEQDAKVTAGINDWTEAASKATGADTIPGPQPEQDHTGFWDAREMLHTIRQQAHATRTAPWAVLGSYLAHVAAEQYPWLQLPAVVGAPGSLNVFLALVAASSGGKTTAASAARNLADWEIRPKQLGSGEGLMHSYVQREKYKDTDGMTRWSTFQHTERVLAVVDEVETLTALGGRQGATLLPLLRSMWSGADVGFGYADPTKALEMAAHTYRLALIVGVQPGKAGELLNAADAGMPQRFLWLPTTDPTAPQTRPEPPPKLVLKRPRPASGKVMSAPAAVVEQIDAASLARLHNQPDAEDGHQLYSRLKVAGLFAIADGRGDINTEDWELAGHVGDVSTQTRQQVVEHLKTEARKQHEARSDREARTAIVVDEKRRERFDGRIAKTIARHVHKHRAENGCTKHCIRPALASRDRKDADLETSASIAASVGWVECRDGTDPQNGNPVTYVKPGKEQP